MVAETNGKVINWFWVTDNENGIRSDWLEADIIYDNVVIRAFVQQERKDLGWPTPPWSAHLSVAINLGDDKPISRPDLAPI